MSDLMRFSVSYIFVSFSLTAVSCQDQVTCYKGDDVLLPCMSTGADLAVFWTDKNDDNVLTINQSKPDYSSQHEKFKGRVESFPDQYKKGNFSILLKKVQQSDSGSYYCFVPKVKFEQRVQLTVTGERAATSPAPGSSAHITGVTLNSLHLTLISVILFNCCST
ncbi:V-set domain-containing T-cell activation inhibitor 1-like isoform X1 [Channa argus]|uniref:V-set domain-containing T-cell activation inhibitor 1-like isoform X1 n=1 Tax=Channa argus TaxID=215402 RepID=UPI003521E72A